MWHKFDMVRKVINTSDHDWVWWMDFDTLITNTDIKLQDIISEALANATDPDQVDWLFTPDWYVTYQFSQLYVSVKLYLRHLVILLGSHSNL
jgi:hypothetical protein